ncbi:MAG: hypothetical protein AB7E09_00970 [Candidatus Izemoplasmatales bacterium]
MARKKQEASIEVIWLKTIIYGLILLLIIVLFSIAPKRVFYETSSYELATSSIILEEDNLLLYDYKVYGTDQRFQRALSEDVEIVKQDFLDRNEIMAVKIYGEISTVKIYDNYVFLTDPETPTLNIEYYIVKDLEINNIQLSIRSFIMLFEDISILINGVYLGLLLIISISFLLPFSVKLTRNISFIVQRNRYLKSKKN